MKTSVIDTQILETTHNKFLPFPSQHFLYSKNQNEPAHLFGSKKTFWKIRFSAFPAYRVSVLAPVEKKGKPSGYCCCRHWFDLFSKKIRLTKFVESSPFFPSGRSCEIV